MPSARPTVWIIDDEVRLASTICVLLEARGFGARCFTDPAALYGALDEEVPEVVVTDYRMPGSDGGQLAQELLRRLGPRTPRVVCVTGWRGQIRPEHRELFCGVLDKPFAVDDLARVIERANEPGESHLRLRALSDLPVARARGANDG